MNQSVHQHHSQVHEPQYETISASKQQTVIVGVDISFWDMMKLIVTFSIASIPAMIIVFFFFMVIGALFTAIFGGLGAMFI